jgi:hypothetical protein
MRGGGIRMSRAYSLLVIALALVALDLIAVRCAYAQTSTVGTTLKFTAPTQHTDGTPITGTLSYVILSGPKGGSKTRLTTPGVPAGTTLSGQAPGTCYQVIAAEAGIESAPSNEACLSMPPSSPSGLTVTVTIQIGP